MTEDIDFKTDPAALESILNNRGIQVFKKPNPKFRFRNLNLSVQRGYPSFCGGSEKKKKTTPEGGYPARTSFSEQKVPVQLDKPPTTKARKNLKFTDNNTDKVKKGMAAKLLLLGRESIAGLPRDSLSNLFRQSLSMADLDNLFEDDSTDSFEALEKRLKLPSKQRAFLKLIEKDSPSPGVLTPNRRRCQSVVDVSSEVEHEHVIRSQSVENLSSLPDWLVEAKNVLKEIKLEDEALAERLKSINERAAERRRVFKESWGVSPKSINKVRSSTSGLLKKILSTSAPCVSDKEARKSARLLETDIRVDFPIRIGKQCGNISIIREDSHESSLYFTSPEKFDKTAPTPAALRHISKRAQMGLDSLYEERS